jgi:peptidoglycan hydrolase CwlO-like protein
MYFLISIFIFSPFVLALLLFIVIEFQKKNKHGGLEIIAGLLLVPTFFVGFYSYTVADLNDWFKEENGKQAKEISMLTEQNKELKILSWEVKEKNKKLEKIQGQLAEKSKDYETLQEKNKKLEEEERKWEEWQDRLKTFENNISELAISLNQTTKTTP